MKRTIISLISLVSILGTMNCNGGFVATRELPVAEVGELLVIECAGAYGFVMGSNYNSKPLAAEVLLQRGKAHLVRKRQSFDDIVRGESIPR